MQPLSQMHKDLGVVYSPEILVNYICETTIQHYIIQRLNKNLNPKLLFPLKVSAINDLAFDVQAKLLTIISDITIIDPAVGAGYFLLSAFKVLENLHKALIEAKIQKRTIVDIVENSIVKSLYGVDISSEAVKSCVENLQKYISSRYPKIHDKELLDSLKHQIKVGNALIGNTFDNSSIIITEEFEERFDWDKEFSSVHQAGGFSICVGNPPWNILKPLEKEFFSEYNPKLSKYGVDKQEAQAIIKKLLNEAEISSEWNKYCTEIKKKAKFFKKHYKYQSGLISVGNSSKRISGDLNLYKLFLERSFLLLGKKGTSGMIIPSGIHSDAGTKGLRKLLFENNQVLKLIAFENRKGIFPSIHKSFKFDILIYQKNQLTTNTFQSAFMKKDPAFLTDKNAKLMDLSWQEIKKYSPSSWSILEFKSRQDLDIVKKMYSSPVLGDRIAFTREFDMSMDSQLFNSNRNGIPLFEGKMIHQYNHQFKDPRYWVEEHLIGKKFSPKYKKFKEIRLVFRAVAASTNQRTMISSFIPPNSCCSNSLIIINEYLQPSSKRTTLQNLLFLAGVLNSFVLDYLLRLKISQNLNMFFIRDLPVPIVTESNESYQKVIGLVTSIYSEYKEFRSILKDRIPKSQQFLNLSRAEKLALIDVEVAKLYELSFSDLEYILDHFHIRDIFNLQPPRLKVWPSAETRRLPA